VVQASAGGSHTLCVTRAGAVLAFGSNIKVPPALSIPIPAPPPPPQIASL
jgi:hypothetical protein